MRPDQQEAAWGARLCGWRWQWLQVSCGLHVQGTLFGGLQVREAVHPVCRKASFPLSQLLGVACPLGKAATIFSRCWVARLPAKVPSIGLTKMAWVRTVRHLRAERLYPRRSSRLHISRHHAPRQLPRRALSTSSRDVGLRTSDGEGFRCPLHDVLLHEAHRAVDFPQPRTVICRFNPCPRARSVTAGISGSFGPAVVGGALVTVAGLSFAACVPHDYKA